MARRPTLRLMRGKPCPGAGGLAGRGPRGGRALAAPWDGEAFLLNGFSLQVRCGEQESGVSEGGGGGRSRRLNARGRQAAQEAERVGR